MAKKPKQKQTIVDVDQTLWQVFWSGFFWPLKAIWHGLVWLTHQFPLKQIGHALRWFFLLRPIRFVARILGLRYLRNSWRELRGVTWPTFKESRKLTGAVIIFSIIFGAFVAILDYGLDKVFRHILIKQ